MCLLDLILLHENNILVASKGHCGVALAHIHTYLHNIPIPTIQQLYLPSISFLKVKK